MENACINIVKLCVGADDLQDLLDWQASPRSRGPDGLRRHVTRMWPKRADEILAGGSLFWVIRGEIICRQRILRLDEVIGQDRIRRCGIVLDEEIIRTTPAPKRPFQGWRYLKPEDAPRDLRKGRESEPGLPPDLDRALADIGVL